MLIARYDKRRHTKEDMYGWRCEENTASGYLSHCKKAVLDPTCFENFKSSSRYKPILEHVTLQQASDYLADITKTNPFLLDKLEDFSKANDLIGNPSKLSIQVGERNIHISATTIRYVKVLSDLISLFGSLEGANIVEIGGGYGGLATVINEMFSFDSYINVDLEWPAKLSKLYTSSLGIKNFNTKTPNSLDTVGNFDLFISNYAFSECNLETRQFYFNKVISKSKMGYITHNGDDVRRNETRSMLRGYENFKVFKLDDRKKRHPIFTWGDEGSFDE
tara:strand:- start:1387 stop:2217 length:831 start_codon:yes stop_codon:yes gene_type:complete